MKHPIISIIMVVICGFTLSFPKVEAYTITIEIEAVVEDVEDNGPGDGYLEGKIDVCDIITGYYTYESTTLDSNPLPNGGDYEHDSAPYGIYLTVEGFDFQTDPCNTNFLVEIINDSTSGGLHDSYILRSYNNLPLSNGTAVDHISWELTDYTATALESSALPTIAPVLDDWQSIVGLRIDGDNGCFIIDATVTSAVPEPTSILLLGLGSLFARSRPRIKRVER